MLSLFSLCSSPHILTYPISSTRKPNPIFRSVNSRKFSTKTASSGVILSGSGHTRPKTLFPGGYRRPDIKTPTLVLQLTPEEVLGTRNDEDKFRADSSYEGELTGDIIQARIAGERNVGDRIAGESNGGERIAGERNAKARISGERIAGERIAGDRIAGERKSGERIAGERNAEERNGGGRIAGERKGEGMSGKISGERIGVGRNGKVMEEVDKAVAGRVGIVIIGGGIGGGGRLYEAACLLKEVIRDRAYLLVLERVDIADAVNASGVLLSDQGLPAIVARNTMMSSRSDSVLLPLVARKVSTLEAALSASNSEGADFLIYGVDEEIHRAEVMKSISEGVKVPIFVKISSREFNTVPVEAEKLAKFGAGGFVVSLEELKLFTDEFMDNLFPASHELIKREKIKFQNTHELKSLNVDNGFPGEKTVKLEDKESQLIEKEKSLMLEVINIVQRAVPMMEEVSLLADAVAQLDDPFMLVIVGEFNSGKSTVINALLGKKYMKDGVVPTTNEITFLRYSELESSDQQRCERYPDGQYICFLPSPILKDMIIVDTPGTNVILQRQQRLTEEFVPRADLLLFVISADRPLTESEVAFLRYTQQWKKKVVFVLNKADLYQNSNELQEAIAFIKKNAQKFLNTENVKLYPVAARAALEAKILGSYEAQREVEQLSTIDQQWRTHSFYELEKFLYSFLDRTTSTGVERIRLKLETPIAIAEQLLSSCHKIVSESCKQAKQDLMSVNELVESVEKYKMKMENESIPWKRQILSLIDSTQARIFKVIKSTLRVSNLDLVASYAFKEKSAPIPATSSVQYDIVSPALSEAQKLLADYLIWLQSSNAQEGTRYQESFEKRWSSLVDSPKMGQLASNELLSKRYGHSGEVMGNFNAAAASKLFEQEVREVFLSTFGGLGAAGLSASLLTSVLPTTLEDLIALGLCSAGGLFSVSNFPARRQKMVDKVKRTGDLLAREVEEAMEKDLSEAIENLENFVKLIGKPYQDLAQSRLDELLDTQRELQNVEKKLEIIKIEIQNLHVSL